MPGISVTNVPIPFSGNSGSGGGSGIIDTAILTEAGEYLMTEAGDNLIQE